jgi:nitrous oxide reductase
MGEIVQDQQKFRSVRLSRRALLRNVTLAAAGGAAFLGSTAIAKRANAADTKVAQKMAAYQDTPKGRQRCDNWTYFEPPSSCKVVAGTISPSGWCQLYAKKPA